MNEAEALLKIADAINNLAGAVAALATPLWLMLLFKNMSGDNSTALGKIAKAISETKDIKRPGR